MINLQIFPQTALLVLIDALRSTGKTYKLELYLDADRIGGCIWLLDDLAGQGKLLFAENELQLLMTRFMEYLRAGSEPAGIEPVVSATAEPEHPADATGVAE